MGKWRVFNYGRVYKYCVYGYWIAVVYFVIQAAVTKGINNSIVGKLLEGKDESLSVDELLNKYGKIDEKKRVRTKVRFRYILKNLTI